MSKVGFKQLKKLPTLILLVLCVNVLSLSDVLALNTDDETEVKAGGDWEENETRSLTSVPISIYQNSQYLTIQDSNPVNTITVRITRNDSGATVFENVYPQGQTGLIAIPLQGWSAGSYTIELFGRENNGYLVGTFQILP